MKNVDFARMIAVAVDVQAVRSQASLKGDLDLFGGKNEMLSSLSKTNAATSQIPVGVAVRRRRGPHGIGIATYGYNGK
jgi:hypothetical protein